MRLSSCCGVSDVTIQNFERGKFRPAPDIEAIRRALELGGVGFTQAQPGVRMRARSHPAEHYAQIVCGHFGDNRNRESNGLRHRCDHFEVSQTLGVVAIAKAPVERLVARGRCEPFAFVWTIRIERRRRREYRGRTLINPSVASQGEMWTMLMQMIPSAEAIEDASVQSPKFRTASRRT